jgi:hypothetical protein
MEGWHKHDAKVFPAVIIPPLSRTGRGKAHGEEERARWGTELDAPPIQGDGECEPVPLAVTGCWCGLCRGKGAYVARAGLRNCDPIVERVAHGDALLVGDVAYAYNAAEEQEWLSLSLSLSLSEPRRNR